MAIMQQYRGNEDDWDVTKMKPGQFAVSLDRKYVRMCFAPGVAEKMALYDAFEEDMLQIQQILATCEDIQVAVEAFEVLAEQHANDAAASATAASDSATAASDSATLSESWAIGGTGSRTGEDTNNAEYWAGVAQAVADIQIATNDAVGIVKGNEGEINIDIGGQMSIPSDFSPQETLTEITGTEDKKTLFGKIAKAISDFISHVANTAIHFSLTNNLLSTIPGTALDATQGKALDTRVTANATNITSINQFLNHSLFYTHKVFPLNTTPNGDVTIPLDGSYVPKILYISSNINIYPYNVQSTYFGHIRGNLTVSYDSTNVSGLPGTNRCVHLQDAAGGTLTATIKSLSKNNLVLTITNTSTIAHSAHVYITAY